MFDALNQWTDKYNEDIMDGKWAGFFDWQPYHWFQSRKIEQPFCTPDLFRQAQNGPAPRFVCAQEAVSDGGTVIECETGGDVDIWLEALSPIRNFSKAPEDNVICSVALNEQSFVASTTPFNNVWHAPYVGPM